MFPKLRLKYRRSLISLAGGTAELPITDASARATPLAPAEWRAMLATAQRSATPPESQQSPLPGEALENFRVSVAIV
jgi:hypothetical protein